MNLTPKPPKPPKLVPEFKVLRLGEVSVPYEDSMLDRPEKIAAIWPVLVVPAPWYDPEKEALVVFLLTAQLRVKGWNLVTLGLINQTVIHAREVFRPAIVGAAAHVVLAHNHPSGDSKPSADDIRATREMAEAGRLIGIPLLDHVIVGRPTPCNPTGYVSLKQMGIIGL